MLHLARYQRDALRVYLLLNGATSLCFGLIFTVNMVYQVTVVDLNPLQLVLVGTLLETTIFVLEVPTGIVADVISRRASILIGLVLIGLGFIVEAAIPRFGAVLLAQVLWGGGYTFTSGATEAWIADEVGEERAGDAFLRGSQVGRIGGLVAIPFSVAFASLHVRVPILVGGVLFLALAALLVVIMPERGFTPTPRAERETWRNMAHTFRAGLRLVRGRPVLLAFVGMSVIYGLYSEGLDRLWTAHILENFTLPGLGGLKPVVWFGIISAVSSLLALLLTEIVRRRVNMQQPRAIVRALFVATLLMVLSIFVFALTGRFGLALAALWTFQTLRSTSGPLFTAWINPHITSSVRATVFSMTSQVDAISQMAGGPIIGWIGTTWSIRAAIATSGSVLALVLPLYGRVLRRESPAPVPAEA